MSAKDHGLVLGVDGGGTSGRFALQVGERRYDHMSGAVNVTSDFEASVANLLEGLAALAGKAGVELTELSGAQAFLGLAGVLGPKDAEAVARRLPLLNARIDSDRVAALAGAFEGGAGTLAGLGTGSFMIRQTTQGARALGGWGLALGDEASGAWLGRGLLAQTLLACDGMAQHSALTRAVLSEFEDQPEAISAFGAQADAGEFAGFAPRVFEGARDGDAAALSLVTQGARWIEAGADALGWAAGERLCLTGGVGPAYVPYLGARYSADLAAPLASGLDGALRLARAQMAARP